MRRRITVAMLALALVTISGFSIVGGSSNPADEAYRGPILVSDNDDPPAGEYLSLVDNHVTSYDAKNESFADEGELPMMIAQLHDQLSQTICWDRGDPTADSKCSLGETSCDKEHIDNDTSDDALEGCEAHSSAECLWNRPAENPWWEPLDEVPENETLNTKYPTSDFSYGRCASVRVLNESGTFVAKFRAAVRATNVTKNPECLDQPICQPSPGDPTGSLANVSGTWNYTLTVEWLGQDSPDGEIPIRPDTEETKPRECVVDSDEIPSTAVNESIANCVWTTSGDVEFIPDISNLPSERKGFELNAKLVREDADGAEADTFVATIVCPVTSSFGVETPNCW